MIKRETINTNIPLALGVIAASAGLTSRLGRRQVPGRQLERVVKPSQHEDMGDQPREADATGENR